MSAYNFKNLTIFFILASAFSCAQGTIDPFDRQTGQRQSDFKKIMIKDRNNEKEKQQEKEKNQQNQSTIPQISKLEIDPPEPLLGEDILNSKRKISFFITEEIPLKDVLIELGRAAKIDIDIDPQISGGIIINANNRPLNEIIQRICELGNLRYQYKNGVLYFERDAPFLKNYFVDYLIEGNDLWSEVQSNLTAIMSGSLDSESLNNKNFGQNGSITINKSAGIMSIFANQMQHTKITNYLQDVEKSSSAQVLIEAKVVEVKLNDKYQTGIDWNFVDFASNGRSTTLNVASGITTTDPLQIVFDGDIGLSVSALEEFGSTRTLSSPRVHAINNKKAVLNFTDKLVYFQIQNTSINTGGANAAIALAETVTSTKQEEDVGVELTITPSINIKTQEITLNIQPKITIQSGEVIDPASPVVNGEIIQNRVPIIQTREIDTIAKIQSGNVIVIGGLMKESTENVDSGIPFLQRIPILGNLFKSTSKDSEIVETVIFIKATIVKSSSGVNEIDRELQENFDSNRRKFF